MAFVLRNRVGCVQWTRSSSFFGDFGTRVRRRVVVIAHYYYPHAAGHARGRIGGGKGGSHWCMYYVRLGGAQRTVGEYDVDVGVKRAKCRSQYSTIE